jgi:NAD(P)-dependent dehydrogenase (short-subunit alcohol dehydrogenase family)
VALDVTDGASVARCFDELASWGAPDIVINNAGVTVTKPVLQQTEADWDAVVGTNLKGSWMVAQEAARWLVAASRGGSLINIASILGERVAGGVAPYAISKAGLVQATKAMALELARHGIRVNAILPGYVVTDLNSDFLESEAGQKLRARIPTRRFGQLRDLDGPLLLLASDAGSHITGATLAVDGGHLVSSL